MSNTLYHVLELVILLAVYVTGFLSGATWEMRRFRRWLTGKGSAPRWRHFAQCMYGPGVCGWTGATCRVKYPPSDVELTGSQR